ncbi:MAG: hypothetical protein ACYDGR_14055 [Candidatus Dormibacteria bacterium]
MRPDGRGAFARRTCRAIAWVITSTALAIAGSLFVISAPGQSAAKFGPVCASASGAHRVALLLEHLDSTVKSTCVAFGGDSISGVALLNTSGFEVGYDNSQNPTVVCQVDNEPSTYNPNCLAQGQPYWAFFVTRSNSCASKNQVDYWSYDYPCGIQKLTFKDGEAFGLRFVPNNAPPPPPAPPSAAGVCPSPSPSPSASASAPTASSTPAPHLSPIAGGIALATPISAPVASPTPDPSNSGASPASVASSSPSPGSPLKASPVSSPNPPVPAGNGAGRGTQGIAGWFAMGVTTLILAALIPLQVIRARRSS